MQRSLIPLVLLSCGAPAEPSVPVPQSTPDASVAPPVVSTAAIDAGIPEHASEPARFQAVEVSRSIDPNVDIMVAWSNGKVVPCKGYTVCQNDCFLVATKNSITRDDKGTKTKLPIKASIDPSSLSASADCSVVSFRVDGTEEYETWNTNGTKLRRSKPWQVAGGGFDAFITASGNFLRWEYSRGDDRYEEIKSGVKGPNIGLSTVMSPDETFVFIGGGMSFGTAEDTPAKLIRAKNGVVVYSVPKPAQVRMVGTFCPTGKLLLTDDEKHVSIRATDKPDVLATIPSGEWVFSPDGSQIARADASKNVSIYRLERCQSTSCAPITDCKP